MDLTYDHIQEELFVSNSDDRKSTTNQSAARNTDDTTSEDSSQQPPFDLNSELQETFRAISANPWGARLGGLWGTVRQQGENYYQGARQEYSVASEEAVKGFTDLKETIIGRTRGLSLTGLAGDDTDENVNEKDGGAATPTSGSAGGALDAERSGSDAQDADAEGFISRFRAEAAKRLKDIERAEDAADEALVKFGTNVRNFLRDAVTVAPPDPNEKGSSDKVLFESKDVDGKRVIHSTRFEAQLHVIHTSLDRFTKNPVSDEWPKWEEEFNIDSKTDDIAKDLENYPELRRAMETLVPEKVEYADFWRRYYFLRLVIETEEKKRKELLKASADHDEEIAWDEDSDSDSESPSTPQVKINKQDVPGIEASASTLAPAKSSGKGALKEPRRSNDQQSQADSDASYDLVSGTTSRAPGSPKEKEKSPTNPSKVDESDEEDWE